ncbi:MAG: 5-(carboxyamino)imidazole ribonucleotide mutase [Oscillatoriales cyanobacterium]|nr:MAG: 5-(carboxyamino)imidazole ribonucleotide mutase [Oscillatoriales cyanobacterium]
MSDPSASPIIGVIMGSDSDLPTMQDAIDILERFHIPHEVAIVSAHRTPDRMVEYAKTARDRGLQVIIAGAGGAAHLPGMVAALTVLPVIGVPVHTRTLSGLDSLYSIVQMPRGIPVATVAIGNAQNAGLLAAQILGSRDPDLGDRLEAYRNDLKVMVETKQTRLESLGSRAYLEGQM